MLNRPSVQYWLSRAAFSFIIIAAVLIWNGYKLLQQQPPAETWRWALCFVGAGACAAFGVAGIRARHREGM
jgi:hypothetical protein